MGILNLVRVPSEALRQKSLPVAVFDKRLKKLARDMADTLNIQENPPGVGLAAIQVGIAKRMFLMKPGEKIRVVINPEIVWKSESEETISKVEKKDVWEGCLSVPGHFGEVKRAKQIKLRYQTFDLSKEELKPVTKETLFRGFSARIVQHEMDHLNGGLFVDELLKQKGRLFKIREGEWEEVKL